LEAATNGGRTRPTSAITVDREETVGEATAKSAEMATLERTRRHRWISTTLTVVDTAASMITVETSALSAMSGRRGMTTTAIIEAITEAAKVVFSGLKGPQGQGHRGVTSDAVLPETTKQLR